MIPQAHLVVGLAYGDEGKGSIVDALVRRHNATLVIRYNGGSQCAHNVITPDNRHHTFAQFGSGSFVPNLRTHLSRFTLINPLNMMCEEEHLREVGITDIWQRTTVEESCLIITPYQKAVNRIFELFRQGNRHGSCGQGIGQAREDHLKHHDKVLIAGDLVSEELTKEKLEFHRKIALEKIAPLGRHIDFNEAKVIRDPASVNWIWQQYKHWPADIVDDHYLADLVDQNEQIVFEGAQGVLLDEVLGTAPYNTWTDITFNNADTLLELMGFNGKRVRLGVIRTYFTRHGAGPFDTEDERLTYPEPHNGTNIYQQKFRLGHFDWVNAQRAVRWLGGVDYIALNHMDMLENEKRWELHERIESDLAPILIDGAGPRATDKYFAG